MFVYEKKLQYPVRIANPNPKLAAFIISQSRFRHTKENRARGFVLSPCSPRESAFLDTIPKVF